MLSSDDFALTLNSKFVIKHKEVVARGCTDFLTCICYFTLPLLPSFKIPYRILNCVITFHAASLC